MRRIGLAVVLALSLVGMPLASGAQQARGKTRIIGYLAPVASRTPIDDVFERSLEALGWVKNQNIRIEGRYSAGRPEALAPLAAELVHLSPDVLVAWGPDGALAAKRATSHIPVVFLGAGEPVAFGLVSNLAHPDGNVTGLSFDAGVEIRAKSLELLQETVPSLTRVAVLRGSDSDPRTMSANQTMYAAAQALKIVLSEVEVMAPAGLEAAIQKAKAQGSQALYIWPSGLTFSFGKQISEVARATRLPSIHPFRESAIAGGLLSYAPSLTDIARRGAAYVDKILRGSKPADLPVEQPTKFELIINLKTAKALGLTIPQSLLVRADELIQ